MDTKCDLSETSKDLRYWSSIERLSESTQANILNADIVVVPNEGFRDYPAPLFPAGTAELFQYLRRSLPPGNQAELAVEDEDFRELSLHADIVTIATCVVKLVGAPLLVSMLAEWIKRRLGTRFGTSEVRASLTVTQADGDRNRSIQISFDGPASTFEAAMKSALDKVASFDPRAESLRKLEDSSGTASLADTQP